MLRLRTSPNRRLPLLVAAAVLFAAGPSVAQQPAQNPSMPGMPSSSSAGSPLMQAMDKMDKGMAAAPTTGDTDQDFVAMMIPHHQGAVDMAKVELSSGKDPQLHRLAQNIIASQEHQIREMKNWQAKHPVKSP